MGVFLVFVVIPGSILAVVVFFSCILLRHVTSSMSHLLQQQGGKGGRRYQVAFLHPDLGIGGAERLIVDAAVGLQSRQHIQRATCTIFTPHHDRHRAFEETTNGAVKVVVVGGGLFPRHVLNRGHVLFATLRMCCAAIYLAVSFQTDANFAFDVLVIDQVSSVMPLVKLLCPKLKMLFYCHFPDQLCDPSRVVAVVEPLTRTRTATLKKSEEIKTTTRRDRDSTTQPGNNRNSNNNPFKVMYRSLFDWLESRTIVVADSIVCNSQFTRCRTIDVFPQLHNVIREDKDIFYPPIDLDAITSPIVMMDHGVPVIVAGKTHQCEGARIPATMSTLSSEEWVDLEHKMTLGQLWRTCREGSCVVSVNRFERKKNISLAIRAFALVIQQPNVDGEGFIRKPHLILAGGYDPRLPENKEHVHELEQLVEHLHMAPHVTVLKSITTAAKRVLLQHAVCVVYTPENEHFGIVPLEAMACGTPVLAVNSGGPLESIGTSDVFGYLRPPDPGAFADVMAHLMTNRVDQLRDMARERVTRLFSLETFSTKLMMRIVELTSVIPTDKKKK